MGCGASRSVPVAAATLTFIPRVEKESDDFSLEAVQLRRLGIGAYDQFFTDFEGTINCVVDLNNALHDALFDVKASVALATSSIQSSSLELQVTTDSVHGAAQLLFDVSYSDGSGHPLPLEVRHLLASRPAVAEADQSVADSVDCLTAALQAYDGTPPVRLSYDDAKQQLQVLPGPGWMAPLHQRLMSTRVGSITGSYSPANSRTHSPSHGNSVAGSPRQSGTSSGDLLQQHAEKVSAALAALRREAPGMRVNVTVVPAHAAPAARTFAWRLLHFQADEETPTAAPADAKPADAPAVTEASPIAAAAAAAGGRHPAGPLRIASMHNAEDILDAVATVTKQAAAVAAATAALPAVQLRTQAGRRLLAATPPPLATPESPASGMPSGSAPPSPSRASAANMKPPAVASAAAVAAAAGGGVAPHDDEVLAVLRRAVSSANHALFRLRKCTAAAGTEVAVAGDNGEHPSIIVQAVLRIVEAVIRTARQQAAAAAAADRDQGSGGSPDGVVSGVGGDGASLHIGDVVRANPRLVAVDPGSEYGRIATTACTDGSSTPRDCDWSWEWGIEPRGAGVTFPACLTARVRALYDAVNAAVAAARSASARLPQVQRAVVAAVAAAEAVFAGNDELLTAKEGVGLMAAGRLRAALDRNANTISASPALCGPLLASLERVREELRAAAQQVRALVAASASGGGGDSANTGGDGGGSSGCGDGKEGAMDGSGSGGGGSTGGDGAGSRDGDGSDRASESGMAAAAAAGALAAAGVATEASGACKVGGEAREAEVGDGGGNAAWNGADSDNGEAGRGRSAGLEGADAGTCGNGGGSVDEGGDDRRDNSTSLGSSRGDTGSGSMDGSNSILSGVAATTGAAATVARESISGLSGITDVSGGGGGGSAYGSRRVMLPPLPPGRVPTRGSLESGSRCTEEGEEERRE